MEGQGKVSLRTDRPGVCPAGELNREIHIREFFRQPREEVGMLRRKSSSRKQPACRWGVELSLTWKGKFPINQKLDL